MDVPAERLIAPAARSVDGLTKTAPSRRDKVECSVFAPASPKRGRPMLVQALLHRVEEFAVAIRRATEVDASANRKGFVKLSTTIKRGALVQLFLEIPRLSIEKPFQEVTWEGDTVHVAYAVDVPPTAPIGPCHGTLHVTVEGLSIGEVAFEIIIGEHLQGSGLGVPNPGAFAEDDVQPPDPVATKALRFTRAFISYSRKDVSQVLTYAEALDDCGIKVLIDLTAIEPGEEWEERLGDLIENSDVFYLMWSKNAALSEWVEKETLIAIARYDTNKKVPRIGRLLIEHPTPAPPNYLERFHFTSKYQAFRTPFF